MTPERQSRITNALNLRQPDIAVVMENVLDPHNVFATMRSCDAVGVQDIFIVNTRHKEHPKFGKSSSSGAAKWLTIHRYDDLETCMQVVKQGYNNVFATHFGSTSKQLYELDLTLPVALVFGNERDGVSEDCLAHCTGNFIIPQVGMIKSLNVSVACAITLYEAFRQRNAKGYYDGNPRLGKGEWDTLATTWGMNPEL